MSIQNRPAYLTAAKLGITEREYEGLIKVRDDLATGRIKYVDVLNNENDDEDCYLNLDELSDNQINSNLFNMSNWHKQTSCGTVHCIKGMMECRGVYKTSYSGHSSELESLFCPRTDSVYDMNWRKLSDVQAVAAIDYFLSGKTETCWDLAIKDIPFA